MLGRTCCVTRLPSNLRQATRECMHLVTYGKLMNFHSTPMALHNLALMPLPLPLPSGWTTSSAEAVHQLRPNAQPRT